VIPALEASGFRNAYARCPSFTTWCGFEDRDVKATFDYILTKGPVETRAVLELPSEEYVVQFAERLPNSTCPSDHLCLVADLEFRIADSRHAAKLQQLGIRKVLQTTSAQQRHKTRINVDMEVESTAPGSSDSEASLPELELSEGDLRTRFSETQDNKLDCFVELRLHEPQLCQALYQVQGLLVGADQNIVADQSCASNDLRLIMNEVRLSTVADIYHIANLCENALKARLAHSPESISISLQGVQVLGDRIIYARIVKDGAAARLHEASDVVHQILRDAGYTPRERGEVFPHVPLSKTRRHEEISEVVRDILSQHEFNEMAFGSQPLSEICLCCETRPGEDIPPVIRRFKLTR
jgi:hypothetical protein